MAKEGRHLKVWKSDFVKRLCAPTTFIEELFRLARGKGRVTIEERQAAIHLAFLYLLERPRGSDIEAAEKEMEAWLEQQAGTDSAKQARSEYWELEYKSEAINHYRTVIGPNTSDLEKLKNEFACLRRAWANDEERERESHERNWVLLRTCEHLLQVHGGVDAATAWFRTALGLSSEQRADNTRTSFEEERRERIQWNKGKKTLKQIRRLLSTNREASASQTEESRQARTSQIS